MESTRSEPVLKAMKIYVVTSGEYSDYGICAMFSSREKADRYMEALPNSGYSGYNEVEEWDLDAMPDPIERGLKSYEVQIRRNGEVVSVKGTNYQEQHERREIYWSENEWIKDDRGYSQWVPVERHRHLARIVLWAENEQGAVKIANERRIQALAAELPVSRGSPTNE